MLLRSSERTSNSKALSTISRFVFRRVSFRALRIKPSLMLMLVRAIESLYTNLGGIGVSRALMSGTRGEVRTGRRSTLWLLLALYYYWEARSVMSFFSLLRWLGTACCWAIALGAFGGCERLL